MERWVVTEFVVNLIFIAWGWHHCRDSYRKEVRHGETTPKRNPSPKGKTSPAQAHSHGLAHLPERSNP